MKIIALNEMLFSSYEMQIFELLEEAYKTEFPNSHFQTDFFKQKINNLKDRLNDKQTFFLAIIDEKKLCGFLWAFIAEFAEQKSLHINQLIIHHSYRRQKFAQSLLDFLEQIARKLGIKQLDLQVKAHIQGAIDLYYKKGFEVDTLILKKFIKESK